MATTKTQTAKTQSVTQFLKTQHDEVKALFKKVIDGERFDDTTTINEICSKLLAHMEAEEKHFYPNVAKKIEEADLVEEAKLEHADAKKIMKLLQTGASGKNSELDEEVKIKVKMEELKLMIEHHIEEEEGELFPQVEENCSQDELAQMCADVESYFEEKMGKT